VIKFNLKADTVSETQIVKSCVMGDHVNYSKAFSLSRYHGWSSPRCTM